MSKVNRRKEIKEKEALQLKFQLALSQNTKNVLNWLPTLQSAKNDHNDVLTADRQLFLDLPIVASGTGLSDLEKSDQNSTVGDFLGSDGTPKNVKPENRKDIRNGSKAMAALMNRMRSDSRKQVREHGSDRVHKNKSRLLEEVKKNQANKKRTKQLEEEDSDEEQSKQSQIGAKKTVRMEFGKGKKRPF